MHGKATREPARRPGPGSDPTDKAASLQGAMAEAARLAQGELSSVLAASSDSDLDAVERLTMLAGAVAGRAARHGADAIDGFLDTIESLTRPSVGMAGIGPGEGASLRLPHIALASVALDGALERLGERLAAAGVPAARITAVEAVLLARLAAVFRPHLVRRLLLAARAAARREDLRPGSIVRLTLEPAAAAHPAGELQQTPLGTALAG